MFVVQPSGLKVAKELFEKHWQGIWYLGTYSLATASFESVAEPCGRPARTSMLSCFYFSVPLAQPHVSSACHRSRQGVHAPGRSVRSKLESCVAGRAPLGVPVAMFSRKEKVRGCK